jgi:hypothetical protein
MTAGMLSKSSKTKGLVTVKPTVDRVGITWLEKAMQGYLSR